MIPPLSRAEGRKYADRARRYKELDLFCIEGEFATVREIATRTGRTLRSTRSRLAYIGRNHPAVTWALLAKKEKK